MYKKVFNIFLYIFAAIGFVLVAGYFAIKFGWTNTSGIIDTQRESFLANANSSTTSSPEATPRANENYFWNSGSEWQTLKNAILKDQPTINRAAITAGVPARLIVAQLVVEQLRFFYTDRESFKKFFEPLKILGSQTQFSWGVMGTKEDTAIQIEKNLKDVTSQYYLGPQFENLLNFSHQGDTLVKQERFTRMTDQHDHYYSYLYAGLYLKEIETQWKSAGFDISNRPEILSTLYNIGFAGSKPNASPQSGGAAITLGDKTYSFGALAAQFYNSSELLDEFPR